MLRAVVPNVNAGLKNRPVAYDMHRGMDSVKGDWFLVFICLFIYLLRCIQLYLPLV